VFGTGYCGISLRVARRRIGLVAILLVTASANGARADQVTIAVAANFLGALEVMGPEFEAATGHRVTIAAASTGQLYAQIINGAPFDVLLAADQERPRRLVREGLGEPASVFTYAVGRLALFSRDPERVGEDTLMTLADAEFRWFAIAEPTVAPYGAAARQALETIGAWQSIEPRIVTGQNVAQAFAMVETGNAELGLVALAQVAAYAGDASFATVPPELHDPVRQDAVLLRAGAGKASARDFLIWLKTPQAAAIIERFGYGTESRAP
jgi:molybdate transport system substrate-binding protein